jgi:hypothetical protein
MNTVLMSFDRNKKIYAIKALRAVTGWGLKEAKEVVDNIEREGPQTVRGFNQAQKSTLSEAGFVIAEDATGYVTDIHGTMRALIQALLDKREFRAAQSVIDALEILND